MIIYLLFFLVAFFSLLAVSSKSLYHSAIYLMGSLSVTAGLYLILEAEFLAGIQVLVYVGGILVLLVFALMLTQSDILVNDQPTFTKKIMALGVSTSVFALGVWLLSSLHLHSIILPTASSPAPSIKQLGHAFLSVQKNGYILAFEIISVLLLTVLISAIVIAKKEKA